MVELEGKLWNDIQSHYNILMFHCNVQKIILNLPEERYTVTAMLLYDVKRHFTEMIVATRTSCMDTVPAKSLPDLYRNTLKGITFLVVCANDRFE